MQMISLDKNESRYPHSPQVLSYLQNISPDVLSVYNPSLDPLVLAISSRYGVPPESIFLANGGEDILKSAISEIVQEGDCVLSPQGGWAYYHELIEASGGISKFFPVDRDTHSYFYSLQTIEDTIKQNQPKLIILASPNNPTGHGLLPEDLQKILSLAEQMKMYVILDEAYVGFGSSSLSYEKIREEYPYLLVVRTFSKFFGLAGLRIGVCFWGSRWESLGKRYYRYLGFSHLSSNIALKALESFYYYQENANHLIRERDNMESFFRSHGIQAYRSQANFLFCFLEPAVFNLASKIFPERGVKIKFFSASKEPWFEGCIRITIGLESENRMVKDIFSDVLKTLEGI